MGFLERRPLSRSRRARPSAIASLVATLLLVAALPTPARAVEGTSCVPEPTDMFLRYGELVTCSIDVVGDSDLFRFQGVAGEVVRIAIHGAGAAFEVLGPNGARIGGSIIAADITLTQSGVHTIAVQHNTNSGTTPYALALDRLSPPAPTARAINYGQNVHDEINPVGDMDLFVFPGAAGTVVRVSTTHAAGFEVLSPGGVRLGGSIISTDVTLTQTGIHTIFVHQNTNSGILDYTLSLQCLVGPCPATPPLGLSASVNQSSFGAGETLTLGYGLANPGRPGAADLYLGIVLPDGSLLFFTEGGGIAFGSLAELSSFAPFIEAIPLGAASTVDGSVFVSYVLTGSEPSGNYTFFLLALHSGALVDGVLGAEDILGFALAPFAFR